MTLREAGVTYDNGLLNVDIGGKVLLADFSVRDITQDEEERIINIAEVHSESK